MESNIISRDKMHRSGRKDYLVVMITLPLSKNLICLELPLSSPGWAPSQLGVALQQASEQASNKQICMHNVRQCTLTISEGGSPIVHAHVAPPRKQKQ